VPVEFLEIDERRRIVPGQTENQGCRT
jgi:hypothetical protein